MTFNTTPHVHSEDSNHHANSLDIEVIKNRVSIIFLSIIILLGTTGNSVVIWVAGFRMKPNVTNVWLVNLAVADLIFCLTQMAVLIRDLFYDHWPFGVFLCKFGGFFKYANMFCSVFLLAVISVDRVLCVCRPVFTRNRRTLCAARVVSVVVWIVAVIFSSPYFVYLQVLPDKSCTMKKGYSVKYAYYLIRFICGFLLPFLVILICYTLAAVGIRRTRLPGKSKPLRILAILVFAFFLCWAPYHILGLVKLVKEKNKAVTIAWSLTSNLAYFNSCINPVLYFCMGLDVRQICKQSLSGIFHKAFTEENQFLQSQESRQESCNSTSKCEENECVTKI